MGLWLAQLPVRVKTTELLKVTGEADDIVCLQCPEQPPYYPKLAMIAWKFPGTKSLGKMLAFSSLFPPLDGWLLLVLVHKPSSGASILRLKPANRERLPQLGLQVR